jgi:hypothetical protein
MWAFTCPLSHLKAQNELLLNRFTLLSPTEARFEIFEDEGDGLDVPEGFSVPVDVIMKKVK